MTLTVEIKEMRLRAFHGVLDQERTAGNLFEVSVRLRCPAAPEAVELDMTGHTPDYSVIADIIRRQMAIPSALLEHVAGRIRTALTDRFPYITGGSVKVAKLTPPMGAQLTHAAVEIDW